MKKKRKKQPKSVAVYMDDRYRAERFSEPAVKENPYCYGANARSVYMISIEHLKEMFKLDSNWSFGRVEAQRLKSGEKYTDVAFVFERAVDGPIKAMRVLAGEE